jgi:tRNA/rRNA methyltransferase|tara:strand:- start:709 stop:1434 length:726 start_codon:yes stop_codon:yes gene_type:complete
MKNKFGFILIRPQLGQNIGSCARVIKNFGFSKLSIVNPRDGWPNYKARMTSVGAFDMLKKVKVYNNTLESIKKYDLVLSTTARKRDINKKHISIANFTKLIETKKGLNIGIMFGPEASGLSNEDLSYSNSIIQIPTSKKFSSMNLSHSMTVICYEIFKTLNKSKFKKDVKSLKIISKKNISKFLSHLINLLNNKNFFKPKEKREAMLLNINNLFYRCELSNKELRILASIVSNLSKKNFKA